MRFSIAKAFVLVLATTELAAASSWFPGSKPVYNKWHQTELERWLSDHDVAYPKAADRKDLEILVKDNWQANVVDPLVAAGDKAGDNYGSVKDWIFDSWTESSLKAFLDHYKIPNPSPRTRDSLLTSARQNYDAVAKKAGEYAAYPGDWLYHSWSESDLKAFLDARGIPAPQPSTRDKLIASVRRNARLASFSMASVASSASQSATSAGTVISNSASSVGTEISKSAASIKSAVNEYLFDTWSDSQLKEFLDEHGVPIPQGSKKNEMVALARKYRASATGNAASTVSGSAASAYGAATSNAANQYAKATDNAAVAANNAFDSAVESWSDSRLKAYLDARGIPVPQSGKRDEVLSAVRLNAHKASTGWSAWTFDTWTVENLQKYLESQGKKAKKGAKVNRDELIKQAQEGYAAASKTGGTSFASITNYLAKQTDAAKGDVFDTWSDSDLKGFLDSYGVPNYQGSNTNQLRAEAKKQYNYFKYGTSSPSGTFFAKIQNVLGWFFNNQVKPAASSASVTASNSASSVASSASRQAASSASSIKKEL